MILVLTFLFGTKADRAISECLKLFHAETKTKARLQQTLLPEIIKSPQSPRPRECSRQAALVSVQTFPCVSLGGGGGSSYTEKDSHPAQSTMGHVKPLCSSEGRGSSLVVISRFQEPWNPKTLQQGIWWSWVASIFYFLILPWFSPLLQTRGHLSHFLENRHSQGASFLAGVPKTCVSSSLSVPALLGFHR